MHGFQHLQDLFLRTRRNKHAAGWAIGFNQFMAVVDTDWEIARQGSCSMDAVN